MTLLAIAGNCRMLRDVNLSGCNITDIGLLHLSSLVRLNTLSLRSCTIITDSGISKFVEALATGQEQHVCKPRSHQDIPSPHHLEMYNSTGLKILNLTKVIGLRDEGLKSISTYCSNLMVLDVDECLGITDIGIRSVVESCTRLRILWVDEVYNVNISREFLNHVKRHIRPDLLLMKTSSLTE